MEYNFLLGCDGRSRRRIAMFDAKSVKVESLAVIRVAVDWENRRIFAPSKKQR